MSDLPRDSSPTPSAGWPPADGGPSSGEQTTGSSASTAETAKAGAKQVADTAVSSGQQVAGTAVEEAKNVAAEAKQQATSLWDSVRTELGQQVGSSQGRIADLVHSFSEELGEMASGSQGSGPLTDLAQEASRRAGEVADWLRDREPADVVEQVRSYARRRPGTFLVLCGLAGVVAGRLTRGVVASRTSLDSPRNDGPGPGSASGQTAISTGGQTDVISAPEPRESLSTGVYAGTVESTAPAEDAPADIAGEPVGAEGDRLR